VSNPIDEEAYGDKRNDDPDAIQQGNPGRPQSELGPDDDTITVQDSVPERGPGRSE
jgi:hypothetical protein